MARFMKQREELKKFSFRIASKMLSSAFVTFTLVFIVMACAWLAIQMAPWIFREGVTDIDPLPILIYSFVAAFAATYVRYIIMKRFSKIRP
jgi:putative flippase GtrA